MQKMTKLKRFFVILLSVVMFTSPALFAGCGLEDDIKKLTKDPLDFETHYGGGGGGSGSEPDATDPNMPLPENELSFDDYYDYFKNYRLTYKPGDVDRESFNQSIKNQNQSIAQSVLSKFNSNYGEPAENNNVLFNKVIDKITALNNEGVFYLDESVDPSFYYMVRQSTENKQYFTHENAILTWSSTENNENKLKLAEAIILAGNYINSEEGENTFQTEYSKYNNEFFADNDAVNAAIDEYVAEINHLGYTKEEIKQLASFILNYIIGEDLVAEDNNRFVNAYCDINGDVHIVYYGASTDGSIKNSLYNKFLTDETYATGMFSNATGNFVFNVLDEYGESENNNLEGLLYYAGEYLKRSSTINNFDYNDNGLLGSTSDLSFDHPSSAGVNNDDVDISQAIYEKLIATDYRKTEIKDENNNVIDTKYNFNANVWGYGEDGQIHDAEYFNEEGRETEKHNVIYRVGPYTHSLFSIRLPYFKNYYNTVHFMVRDMLSQEVTDENRADLDAEWNANHPNMDSYPYSEVFPTVPLTYFADYDNSDMLFDNQNVTHMFSGYQAYQSMVIMPQKDLYLEEASLWFVQQQYDEASNNEDNDFELTIYARYYDAETESYATWGDDNTEFYYVDTVSVPFNPVYDADGHVLYSVPSILQISVKNILNTAKINGSERNSYILNAFGEDEELLTHQSTLLSKDDYGWWFKQFTTPQGDEVVCFDGKNVSSQSYLEFVISNKTNSSFQFCFYPHLCYSA